MIFLRSKTFLLSPQPPTRPSHWQHPDRLAREPRDPRLHNHLRHYHHEGSTE